MIVEFAIEAVNDARGPVRAALADIADSLDLGLIDDADAGHFVVGGRREESLEAALALLAERCPAQYRAGAIQPALAESIATAVTVTHAHKRVHEGSGSFAEVRLAVSPGEATRVEFVDECPDGNLPLAYRAAVAEAVLEEEAVGPFGLPLAAMTVCLKDGKYHDLDSSPEAFAIATREALRQALSGRMKLVEPVVAVAAMAPAGDVAVCARLLRDRGVDYEMARDKGVGRISASARMTNLLGFTRELRAATDGRADVALVLTGYAGDDRGPDPEDSEPMAAALRA